MIKLKENENFWLRRFVDINGIRTKQQKYKAIEKVVSNRLFSSFERNLAVIQAILDGKWEVEEPLYYIHLMSGEDGYLNIDKRDGTHFLSNTYDEFDKTKFTRAEVKAIDPRYLEFLEEVE